MVSSLLAAEHPDNPNQADVADPDGSADYGDRPVPVMPARDSFLGRMLTTNTAGWLLSFGFHVLGYAVGAAIFWWLGLALIPDPDELRLPPIRASLDDQTLADEQPALEIIPAAGPGTAEATQSVQQLASQLAVSDRGTQDTLETDVRIAISASNDATDGDQGESPFFRIPESGLAVTRGSFTAWTDPAQPVPGQSYQIIIEIRLPDKIKRYRLSDLSGEVSGSDRYRQRLPYDSRSPSAARVTDGTEYKTVRANMIVKVNETKLQLAIKVPGAERLVRDHIRIKSRRLREEQELILVFGAADSTGSRGDGEQD